MRFILLTNHLADFAGSEIQILEIYNFCKQKGIPVFIYANYIGNPIKLLFDSDCIIKDPDCFVLNDFDVIWSQHTVFSRFFKKTSFENLKLKIISVHLSPFELFELSSIAYSIDISSFHIANSNETKEKLIEFGVSACDIVVSNNCCPVEFFNYKNNTKNKNKILFVTNHPPYEVVQLKELLIECGYETDLIGWGNPKLITPTLLNNYNLVVTIGKTVQYCLVAGIPVYCYDMHGGPGFLNDTNFSKCMYYNFSGRGFNKKTPEEMIDEIKKFFIYGEDDELEIDKSIFNLDLFMDKIISNKFYVTINEGTCAVLKRFSLLEENIFRYYNFYKSENNKYIKLAKEFNEIKSVDLFLQKTSTEIEKSIRKNNSDLLNDIGLLSVAVTSIGSELKEYQEKMKEEYQEKMKEYQEKMKSFLKIIKIIFFFSLFITLFNFLDAFHIKL